MISHIVLFQPKEGLSRDHVLLFAQQLSLVMRTLPWIRRATVGRVVEIDSGQQRNFGDHTYSFSAVLEFDSREALVDYLNHPEHRELGRLFWEYCQSTVVMDAETIDGMTGNVADLLVM